MYLPRHFEETDSKRLQALMQDHPFATLVTTHEDLPFVTHLPLLWQDGRLFGHMARANLQAAAIQAQQGVLAIFHGPHAYVSSGWYEEQGLPSTWNYAVVHVRGKLSPVTDLEQVAEMIQALIAEHDGDNAAVWDATQFTKRSGAIIGFEIEIEQIEAKFKLSQNRPAGDRERVLRRLRQSSSLSDQEVAKMMEELREP